MKTYTTPTGSFDNVMLVPVKGNSTKSRIRGDITIHVQRKIKIQ